MNWLSYVNALASRMKLGHWDFVILDEPPDDAECITSVTPALGQYRASFRFAKAFYEGPPEAQRHAVVHELIHCIKAHVDYLVQATLPDDAYGAWALDSEYEVDHLASVIAPSMPLPGEVESPWGKATVGEPSRTWVQGFPRLYEGDIGATQPDPR